MQIAVVENVHPPYGMIRIDTFSDQLWIVSFVAVQPLTIKFLSWNGIKSPHENPKKNTDQPLAYKRLETIYN